VSFSVPRFQPSQLCLLALVLCLVPLLPAAGQSARRELRTAAAVRELTVEQTRARLPVHLQGVVTFFDDSLFLHFLQDATAGIYLEFPTNVAPPPLLPGQMVEVAGTSGPGEYAPVVMVDRITAAGQAPLPPAKLVNYESLASGREDSQLIEITGIVRSVRPVEKTSYYQVEITTGGGRLAVFTLSLPVANTEELLDSVVRVRGVCSTQFNRQRQLFALRIMVPRPGDLELEVPATGNPFATATRPIGSLLQFTPQESYGHRVKLAGTVTYFEPGAVLYLQDGQRGVEIQTLEHLPLRLGDRIEALGFVKQGDYSPLLEDAIYRKLSAGPNVAAVKLTADEALKGEHDRELIQVSARLVDRTQHGNEEFLILQESNCLFQASLRQADGSNPFTLPANGSRVAVTGVCRIDPGNWEAGPNWRAKSFSVLLRSAEDVQVVESPSWWTLKRTLWIAGVLTFAMLAALGWVAVLRRQVAERTRELEVQIQQRQLAERRREIEQERARVAHDLHDDLGSRLTEVNMLATLVKSPTTSPEEKDGYLVALTETARQMVTSLDEIVWAVNPRNDTIASLAGYFGAYAQRLLDLADVACGLDIAEDLPEHPLDPKFRHEIFFAFKEALTNVVRHARAKQVWLRISVAEQWLRVEVADDGCGFRPSAQPPGQDGLANMKARLQSLGGQCEITSDTKNGTAVRFAAPLPARLL
jgi:signal transduction histidine kinase